MKYLVLIYGNDEIWSGGGPDQFAKLVREVDAFNQALRDSGELVSVEGIMPRPKAVRPTKGGAPGVSDGPYREAKEAVGSYFVLDVDSEARALEVAAAYPALRYGSGVGGG